MIIAIVLTIIAILALFICYDLGFISKANYIHNYEIDEYPEVLASIKPESVKDGLAIYSVGNGNPVILFPYPHADAGIPMAYSVLGEILCSLGKKVISFDPPGAFYSTRHPTGDMDEMMECALMTLNEMGIEGKVDVVGHSMSSLCALSFAIKYPEKINSLVLIGSMSGFPAAIKYGMPGSTWKWTEIEYWQVMWWGMKLTNGRGNLELHKKLYNLMGCANFNDQSYFIELEIDSDDRFKGVPIRRIWSKNLWGDIDYSEQLDKVLSRTLICVGKCDNQTPLIINEELNKGITNSEMVVFNNSGHSPFIEEKEKFTQTLKDFFVDL
jgi:proline iminopeptidase